MRSAAGGRVVRSVPPRRRRAPIASRPSRPPPNDQTRPLDPATSPSSTRQLPGYGRIISIVPSDAKYSVGRSDHVCYQPSTSSSAPGVNRNRSRATKNRTIYGGSESFGRQLVLGTTSQTPPVSTPFPPYPPLLFPPPSDPPAD